MDGPAGLTRWLFLITLYFFYFHSRRIAMVSGMLSGLKFHFKAVFLVNRFNFVVRLSRPIIMILEVALLVLIIILVWGIKTRQKYSQYPPGPPRLPLVGSLLSIPHTPYQSVAFEKLSKTYGDIVHVKLGLIDAVTFNSYDTVKEILNEDKASWIKYDMMGMIRERNYNRNLGIIFANGEPWRIHKSWTIRTLRNFGFGKSASMDVAINREFDKLLKQIKSEIEENPGGGIQAEDMFSQTTVHILWSLVTGVDYELGDPKIKQLLKISDELVKSSNFSFDLSSAYPILWDWFPNRFGKNEQIRLVREFHQFLRETIQKHRESGAYKTDPQSYVDAFLAKIEESKDDPKSEFNDDQLAICLLDLFQAGGDTSHKTMSFIMMYLILHPNIQEKVRKEIDDKVWKDEMITGTMKTRLPYTHATLLETFRYSSILPFPAPRMATEDFFFRGYLIKKGTSILANLQAAHFSKSKWGDPFNFRPERFLKGDATVNVNTANTLLNFGEGKRVCLGAGLAESSIFIIFASMIKLFTWTGMPGEPLPSMDPVPGIAYSPQPFKIKFTLRN